VGIVLEVEGCDPRPMPIMGIVIALRERPLLLPIILALIATVLAILAMIEVLP